MIEMSGLGVCVFFFNDTATTEIYTLSLHDALPIFSDVMRALAVPGGAFLSAWSHSYPVADGLPGDDGALLDRKSTRLNSSHANISYAVFCLKKKHKLPLNPTAVLPTPHVVHPSPGL